MCSHPPHPLIIRCVYEFFVLSLSLSLFVYQDFLCSLKAYSSRLNWKSHHMTSKVIMLFYNSVKYESGNRSIVWLPCHSMPGNTIIKILASVSVDSLFFRWILLRHRTAWCQLKFCGMNDVFWFHFICKFINLISSDIFFCLVSVLIFICRLQVGLESSYWMYR